MFQVICSVHISHMTFDGYGFNSVCFALFVQNSVSTQNHLTCDNLNVFANLSLQNAFRHVVYVFELWSRKLRCLRVAKLQLILSVFTMLGNKTPDLQSYLSTKTNIVFLGKLGTLLYSLYSKTSVICIFQNIPQFRPKNVTYLIWCKCSWKENYVFFSWLFTTSHLQFAYCF